VSPHAGRSKSKLSPHAGTSKSKEYKNILFPKSESLKGVMENKKLNNFMVKLLDLDPLTPPVKYKFTPMFPFNATTLCLFRIEEVLLFVLHSEPFLCFKPFTI
jgi:hypothetical protein